MSSKKFKERIESNKTCNDDIVKYLFKSKIIDRIFIEVCGDCNYNCKSCGHSSFRSVYKNYHMTIHELNRFLYYTKKSKYYIREACIHGPGEPTLWKNLNEGIKVLHESDVVGGIYLLTNGSFLDRIEEETFEYIGKLDISIYPDAKKNDLITYLCDKYPDKIGLGHYNKFWVSPTKEDVGSIPCRCTCPTPSFIGNKIFYCSGCIFDAAKLKGVDIYDCHEVYSVLKENYLENASLGNFDLCKYCAVNDNIYKQLDWQEHKIF